MSRNEGEEKEQLSVMTAFFIEKAHPLLRVTELVIPSNCCNETDFSLLDMSELKWLKSIEIGNECFENVNEVK